MADQQKVAVIDGGMGKLLQRSGAPFRQPEWSALALLEDPSAVQAAHREFIEAGAEVVIANTYAVVPFHLGEERFAERGAELAKLAGELARAAADEADRDVLVAGSLPPLYGSYEPEKFRPADAPAAWDIMVEAQAPYVDFWIGETVSSIAEARAIVDAVARGVGKHGAKDLWLSFTVPDDPPGEQVNLRSGETIESAVAAVGSDVAAIIFNCSPPEAITVALGHVADALGDNPTGIRFGAYANAFVPKPEVYSANQVVLGRRDELTPEAYRHTCEAWVAAGATIIGGCCEMYPEHIEALATLSNLEPQSPK